MSAPSAISSATSRKASVAVRGVHLIGELVAAEPRAGADGIAERPVKGRGIFRGIAQELRIGEARRLERGADRADAPIHHVGRREDVATGLRLHQRLRDQHLDGAVVVDLAGDHEPVMAVARIGVERHVADDAEIGHGLLDGAHGAADEIAGIDRLARLVVAKRRVGVGKQRDRRDAKPRGVLGAFDGKVDRDTARRPASTPPANARRSPSTTKIGQIRSSVVSEVSRRSRRDQSDAPVAPEPRRGEARAEREGVLPARFTRSVRREIGLSFGAGHVSIRLKFDLWPGSYHFGPSSANGCDSAWFRARFRR